MATKKKSLGKQLKDQRILLNLTLRDVEKVTKISNAYLSQLENGHISNPSVSILSKLASFYKVDLKSLLVAGGIIKGKDAKDTTPLTNFAFSSNNLTKEEEEKLLQYLKFLRSQKK